MELVTKLIPILFDEEELENDYLEMNDDIDADLDDNDSDDEE